MLLRSLKNKDCANFTRKKITSAFKYSWKSKKIIYVKKYKLCINFI